MINRLIQIPLNKDNVNNELDTIYNVASNNGFNRKTISKLFNKINKKHMSSKFHSLTSESEKIYKKIPFVSNHITYPIVNNLRKHGITLPVYNTNNLSTQLINNKLDKIEKINKSGVYKLNCGNCDAIYGILDKLDDHLKNDIKNMKHPSDN